MTARIPVPKRRLEQFCAANGIRRLSFFGSVLRADFRPDSDVDVLVEFEPAKAVTLLGLARMEHELSAILGRRVDLREPEELSPYFRSDVLAQAEVQFANA